MMRPTTPFPHFLGFVVLVGLLLGGPVESASGQVTIGEAQGTVSLEDWPRSLPNLLDDMGQRAPYLLPKIDSLALDYRYQATDTTSQWAFSLSWRPGNRVLHKGNVLSWRRAPSDIRMVNVEFRADVWLDGETVAEMIIAVDSMALGPLPGRYRFNVRVGYDRVFLNTSPEEARRILSEDATLGSLVVERMGFTSAESRRTSSRRGGARQERTETPSYPRGYESQTRLYLGWSVGPDPYYVSDRGNSQDERPRRGSIGRTTGADDTRRQSGDRNGGERSDQENSDGEESSKGNARSSSAEADESEDDEEDETSLRMPALGAVAAVALIGYTAGSVGLYGRGDTPIGLLAGWTHPRGGIQFHAAVNQAVLEGQSGQKLTTKALGFYDVFGARVQPAVGLGVQIDPQREGSIRPSASLGLAGNFNPVVVYGGVDVVQQTPELGITYNFRYGRAQEDEEDVDSTP